MPVAALSGASQFFSRRDTQGESWPLRVLPPAAPGRGRQIEVLHEAGARRFDSFQALTASLHGGRYGTWSWDRYVGQGRYAPVQPFGEPGFVIASGTVPLSESLRGIVVHVPVPKGIDLAARHKEVEKLLYAGFGAQIYANGYDFEDVLQEVFRKLVVANQGKSPWDPGKSSFGHYVHMVCRSALFNYHRKNNRRKAHEQVGLWGWTDTGWGLVDAATEAVGEPTEDHLRTYEQEAMHDLAAHLLRAAQGGSPIQERDAHLAVAVLPLVRQGYGRGEIAEALGIKPSVASRALAYLRTQALTWDP